MRILPLVFCAGLTLTTVACGNKAVAPGTPAVTHTVSVAQGVYDAEGAYIAAARSMAAYIHGDFGAPNQTVVARMRQADARTYALLVPLRADAEAGRPLAQTALDALTAAISDFQAVNATAGVK